MAPIHSVGGLRIELLGPVEAWVDERRVALGGQRPRALLAVLALMAGRVVSSEQLIDELWGEDPPARARESLQMHVSRLRKAVEAAGGDANWLVGRASGYLLELGPGARDVDRWESALGSARQARASGRLEAARVAVQEALGLWRGAPLAGVSAHVLLDAERARLDEERLAAAIEAIELDIDLGRHGEALGAVEALASQHPFAERLVALQMVALYRCGRQADALAAFSRARARLVEELGIEPGQALRELHQDVLRQAETLGGGSAPARRRADRPRPLPVPANRTIDREGDLKAIGQQVVAGAVRLLTLTGPGGVGKTRLGVEAARGVVNDFVDGGCFVSLSAVRRPEDAPAAVLAALGVIVLIGETPGDAVQRFLADKHLLLVIDNFEHVLGAAPFVAGLLESCAALTVLATSREPLALHAEQCYRVSPLALPEKAMLDDACALAGVGSVALFCERARAREPSFRLDNANAPAVAEICRRLDGLPLAIELAAARCGLLSPCELAERLHEELGALGAGARDAPARQQTLRATIDWSHKLLAATEKQCFARFAVFAGGATIEAAETVTQAELDTLDQLVAKSLLVRQDADGHSRLGMLETLRAYATRRLSVAPDEQGVRERHYAHFLALARREGDERVLWGTGGNGHLARVDAEIDNLHAALGWATARVDAERALAMCAALRSYWSMRGRPADAIHWVEQARNLPDADAQPALCVDALEALAFGLRQLGRTDEAASVLADAEAVARDLDEPATLACALERRAVREVMDGRREAGDALADEALEAATAANDSWAMANAAFAKALAAPTSELRQRVDRAAALLDEVGNIFRLSSLFSSAAYGAVCSGDDGDARDYIGSALRIAREDEHPFTWMGIHGNLGLIALLSGDTDAASRAFREELGLCRELVARPYDIEGLRGLAAVAAVSGEMDRAARLVGAATAHRYGQPQDPVDARLDAAFFTPARGLQPAAVWSAAAREGAALSFEDAVAYALA